MTDPVHIYPLYENATQFARAQTPEAGLREAARLWARYAAVAAQNPYAWLRTAPTATVATTLSMYRLPEQCQIDCRALCLRPDEVFRVSVLRPSRLTALSFHVSTCP